MFTKTCYISFIFQDHLWVGSEFLAPVNFSQSTVFHSMSTKEQNIDYFLLTFAVNCKSKCMWRKIGISLSFISTGVLKPERKKNIFTRHIIVAFLAYLS